jgi:hypothetical protein
MAGVGEGAGRAPFQQDERLYEILAAGINSFRRLLGVLDLRGPNLREWRQLRRCFVSGKNGSNARCSLASIVTLPGHARRQLIDHPYIGKRPR